MLYESPTSFAWSASLNSEGVICLKQDIHFISARAACNQRQQQEEQEQEEEEVLNNGFERLCEQIRAALDDAIQARTEVRPAYPLVSCCISQL